MHLIPSLGFWVFTQLLHEEMGIVTRKIVEDNQLGLGLTQIEITTIVGSAQKLTCKVTVVCTLGFNQPKSTPHTWQTLADSNAH